MTIEGEMDLEWIYGSMQGGLVTWSLPFTSTLHPHVLRPSLIPLGHVSWFSMQTSCTSVIKYSICWCCYKWYFKNSVLNYLLLSYGNIICTLLNLLVNSNDLFVDSFSFFLYIIMLSTNKDACISLFSIRMYFFLLLELLRISKTMFIIIMLF